MVVRVAGGKYLWCMVIVAAGWCMVVAAGWCMVAAGGGGCLGGTMVLHHRPVRYGHLSLVPAPTTRGGHCQHWTLSRTLWWNLNIGHKYQVVGTKIII